MDLIFACEDVNIEPLNESMVRVELKDIDTCDVGVQQEALLSEIAAMDIARAISPDDYFRLRRDDIIDEFAKRGYKVEEP